VAASLNGFDVETTIDAHSGQVARVGVWQDHGLRYQDRCALFAEGLLTANLMDYKWREGVFYNRAVCTPEEIETIKAYAVKHGLACMEMNDFITKVFYPQAFLNKYISSARFIWEISTFDG